MKYSQQIKKRKHNTKSIRKNPLALVIPAIPAIAEGAAALWAATIAAAPYIVAAFTTGATVGLIERQLNKERTKIDSLSEALPPTLYMPESLDWFKYARRKKTKAYPLPKTTTPIPAVPTPPQKPDIDWLERFLEWFEKSIEKNPSQTLKELWKFLKEKSKTTYEFIQKNINRLDAWEKANPWKKRAFLFFWIVYVSPYIDAFVEYIEGSTEPYYRDSTFKNLTKTLNEKVDAYPFLKKVRLVDHSNNILLNISPSLSEKYPEPLDRSLYSYEIKTNQELQACAESCLVNIKKYHKDEIGEHNTVYVPKEIAKPFFENFQFEPGNPFSFKVLQGVGSNCNIPKIYSNQDSQAPTSYRDRQKYNWKTMFRTLNYVRSDNNVRQLQEEIFTPRVRYLLSLAASVTISQTRKYWRERYDVGCYDSNIQGLQSARNVFNNLPNIFDISDRMVPYVEEHWTWANLLFLENLVPQGPAEGVISSALKPAFYYDVLKYIQDQQSSKTIRNLEETEIGRNKLRNVEMLYTQTIWPIKKDISPLETQRIVSNLIWVLMNDAGKLKDTPIDQPYYLKNWTGIYERKYDSPTIGKAYSSKPNELLTLAIENYLFEALGFSSKTDVVSTDGLYAYFRFSLSLLELISAFEQGLSNEDFVAGLKNLLKYLTDASFGAVTTIVKDYAIVFVSQLLENRITLLRSETMVVVFMNLISLIMPDFIGDYLKNWVYFNKSQNQVLEDFYRCIVDVFVDHAVFSKDEVSNGEGVIFDRIFIPTMQDLVKFDELVFCDKLANASSSRILSGVIFFENEKV